MIRATTASMSPSPTDGKLTFHIVVDYANRSFSMDGLDGPNGVRLHYEVMKVARGLKRRFWEFDIRAESQEHALAEMRESFPGHSFVGTWASANLH